MRHAPDRRRTALLVASTALLLAACAGPVKAPLLLTLPAPQGVVAAGEREPAAPGAAARLLVLRRVAVPEYLVSNRVRYRDAASTLAEWPDTVWAERIEVGVTRSLSDALRRHLPGWTVCQASCPDGAAGTAVLRVELLPLDLLRAQRRLQGTARIGVSFPGPGRAPWSLTQALDVTVAGDTPQAHATALSQALDEVAAAVARRLQAQGSGG